MSDANIPQTREERLAARLRENLKRRKAQARAFETAAQPESESPDSRQSGLSKPAA